MNTIGAESISEEEAVPGQVVVTGHGSAGGRTATTCVLGAAMMTDHQTGEHMTGDTVAATDETTTAGVGERPTMTQTIGIPMNTTGRIAVIVASAAAAGSTGGVGDAAEPSATRLRTAAGEPRV